MHRTKKHRRAKRFPTAARERSCSSLRLIMSSTNQVPSDKKNILVTGGTGYIGTHTVLCLIEAGYDVTVMDNLINSSEEGIRRVREITNCEESRIRCFNVDICNKDQMREVFQNSPRFSACIHFAGLKAVGESVQKPLLYYENNVYGTLNLLNLMDEHDCHAIVFSSSATVCKN
jgi:UDP-glucose 4-epimerase